MAIEMERILSSDIQASSLKGLWLNGNSKTWSSLGTMEWAFRSVLSRVSFLGIDSVEQACLRYSWKSIEQMPEVSDSISQNIEGCFNESINPGHALNKAAHSIAAIYFKTLAKNDCIEIKEHNKYRLFEVLFKGVKQYTVLSSGWGKLDFYDQNQKQQLINEGDVLLNSSRGLIGAVKFKSDEQGFMSKVFKGKSTEVQLSGVGDFSATMKAEGDSGTFVFRDINQKIMGLALWEEVPFSQQWKFTLLGEEHKNHIDLFVWALLKQSQTKMRSLSERPYIISSGEYKSNFSFDSLKASV